jgi:hypothetical protein
MAYRALGTVEQAVGWSPRLALLRRSGVRRTMHQRVSAGPVEMLAGSGIARRLHCAARPDSIVAARRRNYAYLLDVCRSLDCATPLYPDLPEGVCPLGFPLVVEERDRFRDLLLARGVNVRTYWDQLPPQVDLDRFSDAAWLSDRILVLPTHQAVPFGAMKWLGRQLLRLGRRARHNRT